jgi:hypothetical protein
MNRLALRLAGVAVLVPWLMPPSFFYCASPESVPISKWNAFDLVVTVALGSSLSTAILSSTTSLADGVITFATLILLQLAITWLSVRFVLVQRIVKAKPSLLLYKGEFREDTLRRERVTESEVRAALRYSASKLLPSLPRPGHSQTPIDNR